MHLHFTSYEFYYILLDIDTLLYRNLISGVAGGGGCCRCSNTLLGLVYLLYVYNKVMQDKLFYNMAAPPYVNITITMYMT